MAVIILHPTEELIFAKLQKELISELFVDDRIMVAVKPLWIEVSGGFNTLATRTLNHRIELGDFETSEKSVCIPVTITSDDRKFSSKLTLVNIHSGQNFTDTDHQIISKIKQPVRQLKVFRLGNEKELSSVSKCITEFKWIKVR